METVVKISKGDIPSKRIRVEFPLDDLDIPKFQCKASYEQIKARVNE